MHSRAPWVLVFVALSALLGFGADTIVFGPETFTRAPGKPRTVTRTFQIKKPTGTYLLRVVNHGVTSAEIQLNGRTVLESDDFTEKDKGRDKDKDRDKDRDQKDKDRKDSDEREGRGQGRDDDRDHDRDENHPVASLQRRVTLRDGKNTLEVELRSKPGTSLTLDLISVGTTPPTDTTPPAITASATPPANANGWNNANVTVSFTCADAGSGIAACPAPVTVSAEGANQVVAGTATDKAGNSATASVTLNIDKTSPVVTASLSPTPDGEFSDTAVTAHFACSDDGSGVFSCPTDQLFSTEGTGLTATGTGADRAGNTATATSARFSVDLSAPTITVLLTPAPNANGWNNTPVTAHFSCSDAVAGVAACPPDQTITTDGAAQPITGTATDHAGHTATASATVNLDRAPPVLQFTSPANGAFVFTPTVTALGAATDALSGVSTVTCDGLPATLTGGDVACGLTLVRGPNAITAVATDRAGNSDSFALGLNYRRVPIVQITSPQNLGYHNISPTTVTGTVDDPTAVVTVNSIPAPNVGGTFSIPLPLAEGPNIITASASTDDGAVGTASIEVTLDTTPPRVTITSPPNTFVTTDDHITVSGNVNDLVVGTVNDEQARVTINGAAALVANRTFLASDVPLALGPNVIQAIGTDRVGNAATVQITVTRKAATAPQITLISGNNQAGAIGEAVADPLVVSLTDAVGAPVPGTPVIFKVTQNDGTVAAGGAPAPTVIVNTDDQGRASARWTLGHRAGAGGNAVEAYSVSFEGTALFTASGTQGAAGKVVVDTGNDQIGGVSQPLPKPFIAVVVDEGNNRLGGVPVTFHVRRGGGSFDGQTAFTVTSDSDGRVAATLTLGPVEGNANNLVEATFESNTGFPASFTASGRMPGDPADTTISGVVLDNSNTPIPGVTIRAVLTSVLRSNLASVQAALAVQTDAQGQFVIPQAPVGLVKLLVEGSTAELPGTFPSLEYDMVTVAGRDNTVGQPIFLLPLNTANQLCVTATAGGGTLTIPEAPGFSLTFGPGQVTFPGGSKTGCVSVTIVHGDKVPMVPGFGQQPRFIVTIQPSGAIFNPPAPITLPNVDGLAPRAVTEMYSFDHDIGSFVAIGTGVVSDDGLVLRSSPGVGVMKAGWHCGGDPSSSGSTGSIAVSLSAAAAEETAGNTVDLTASGSPPEDGTYVNWEVIDDPADPDDDPTVASLTASPSCDGQPTCVAPLKGQKIGIASVRVSFTCTTTGVTVTSGIVKVKFTLGLKVKEVSFTDDIDIYEDRVGSAPKILDPVWKDTNAAADNKPAAYVRSSTMKVTVKFEVSPVPTAPVSGVTIEGEIPGLGKFVKTGVTIPAAAEVTVSDLTFDTALPATTKYYNPLTINWQHMADGKSCPACTADGSSANQVYVTLATPTQAKVFRSTLHFAVSNDGASTPAAAVSNSWSLFAGPANITTWDGRKLYYYRSGVGFFGCALDEEDLLTRANGSGQCGSFARLLMATYATNGVPSLFAQIFPTTPGTQMVVNDWNYVGQTYPAATAFKWRVVLNAADPMVPARAGDLYGDLHSQTTLHGQNTAPPSEKVFGAHFVVYVSPAITGGAPYYDPSYGVTYLNAADLELKAIKGYLDDFSDGPGIYRFRERGGPVGITLVP